MSNGLVAIVDAQKCPWRGARDQIKFITQHLLDKHLIKVYAIRSDAFSVQNCAKSYKKGEVRSQQRPMFMKLNLHLFYAHVVIDFHAVNSTANSLLFLVQLVFCLDVNDQVMQQIKYFTHIE